MAGSLETNKLVAAILTAGIIAAGSGVISRILYNPHIPTERAFKVEIVAATQPAASTAATEAAPIAVRLASADPGKGQGAAKVCTSCHSFEQGGANKVGPNLWNVVGDEIGKGRGGFAFSEALSGKGGNWSYENLDGFISNPKTWAPGTKMSFAGIGNPEQRADVIAYLRTLSDSPQPLPEAAPDGKTPATEKKESGLIQSIRGPG